MERNIDKPRLAGDLVLVLGVVVLIVRDESLCLSTALIELPLLLRHYQPEAQSYLLLKRATDQLHSINTRYQKSIDLLLL